MVELVFNPGGLVSILFEFEPAHDGGLAGAVVAFGAVGPPAFAGDEVELAVAIDVDDHQAMRLREGLVDFMLFPFAFADLFVPPDAVVVG